MSTAGRLVSASIASWIRIGITVISQIALVPIFLERWDHVTYGAWLAILTVYGFMTLADISHHDFLGFEFLRLGRERKADISRILSASLPFALGIGTLQFIVIGGIVGLGLQAEILGLSAQYAQLSSDVGKVLIANSTVWLIFGSIWGILQRVVFPFGYFSRMSWWNVVIASVTTFAPAVAAALGANLLHAGLTLAVATAVMNVVSMADIWRLMKREGIRVHRPSPRLGGRNFLGACALMLRSALEILRNQGVRLILSPMVGVAQMATFATIRTGANVALQGIGTVTNPLFPELMRVLAARDQERTEGVFGFIWLVLAAVLIPSVTLLQLVMPAIFASWTRGKMQFDPVLFSTLSVGVLVYAVAQPPAAVVRGNNLLRAQLVITALSSGLMIVGLFLLVPHFGIRVAGLVLLLAEIVSLAGYFRVARSWMSSNHLQWPTAAFLYCLGSVMTAWIGTGITAMWPRVALVATFVALLVEGSLLLAYWRTLPQLVRERGTRLFAKVMPRR